MKPEDLDLMLAKQSPDECAKFFARATEADRKAVAARAMQWYEVGHAFRIAGSQWTKNLQSWNVALPKHTQKALELVKQVESKKIDIPKQVRDEKSLPAASLAVLASSGLTDARDVGIPPLNVAFAILRERRPRWLDRWMSFVCRSTPGEAWNPTRQVELDGICTAERDSGYWLAMALTLGQLEAAELISRLHTDSELLSHHIWCMLDDAESMRLLTDPTSANQEFAGARLTERMMETPDFWKERAARAGQWERASYIWKTVLAEMAASGQIEKERLVDFIFEWIARLSTDGESRASVTVDRRTSPVGWFQALHDEIGLGGNDSKELIGRYVALLSSKDSSTLCWALSKIKDCPIEYWPVQDLLANFSNVFSHKRKEPAVAALKLLEMLCKEESTDLSRVGEVALEAFEHKSADIHKRSLSFLKKSKAIEKPEIAAGLKARLDSTSGLLKKEVADLVSSSAAGAEEDSVAADEDANDAEDILSRARQMAGHLADEAGIAAALAACEGNAELPECLTLESMSVPRLNPDQKITPVDNLDDLIYLLLHVLEGAAGSDDFERALDGLMRLCNERPADFELRTSSLSKKVKERLGDQTMPHTLKPFSAINMMVDLAGVVSAWIAGKAEKPGFFKPILNALGIRVSRFGTENGPMRFISLRLEAIAKRAGQGIALPMLAAPTHKGGWIDPIVMPDRLRAWQAAGMKIDKVDLIQSLLRLAPDNREQALSLMPPGNDEILNTLRYALGGEMNGSISSADLWVAAYRCREPRGTSDLLKHRFKELGPDSAVRASYCEHLEDFKKRGPGIFGTTFDSIHSHLPITSSPPVEDRPALGHFPTELLHVLAISWETSNLFELIWPLDRESYFYHHARRMSAYLDSTGTYWQGSWEPLFDPDVPASGMGTWLIALSLSAKQTEAARTGLDALIACIEDDRLDATAFGTVLAKLYYTEKITLSRWITAFKVVARISPLHRHFLIRALEICLSGLPSDTGKSAPIPVLELLHECLSENGDCIVLQTTRDVLKAVAGKGKGAKIAKLILELPPAKSDANRRKIALQILQSRMQRVERWQTCLSARQVLPV